MTPVRTPSGRVVPRIVTPAHMVGYAWAGWLIFAQLAGVGALAVWGPYR